jgi:hypothetical protein
MRTPEATLGRSDERPVAMEAWSTNAVSHAGSGPENLRAGRKRWRILIAKHNGVTCCGTKIELYPSAR